MKAETGLFRAGVTRTISILPSFFIHFSPTFWSLNQKSYKVLFLTIENLSSVFRFGFFRENGILPATLLQEQ
jgi:hypothetical protein